MLYLHWEWVSRLTGLHSALPDCINLHLCAFNLIKTGLLNSWSYAAVGKRGSTEDCSQTALAPWAVEGCIDAASPATFHHDRGEMFLSVITLILCPHLQPSSMVAAALCALSGQSHWRLLRQKNCLCYPGSSSPPKDTCHQHSWRYPVWHRCLQGSPWWWGKQQGKCLASLARYSAVLDPGDGGGSDMAEPSWVRREKDNPNGHWWFVFLL